MKKVITKYILLGMLLFFFTGSAFAQQLSANDFNFSGNLTANGWVAHSAAGTNAIATTTGLTYTGLLGSGVGNAALVNNLGGEDVNLALTAQSTDGQNIYLSCMVNITDPAATKSGDYFLHLGSGPGATFSTFAARVFARITASGVNFGLSNTATATYGTTNFTKNTTYLLIMKYTISVAGNDPVSLWVIPTGVPASEALAGTPEVTNTTTAGTNTISALGLRQGSATTSVQTVVDGLIVGLSWADVTPTGGGGPSLNASGSITNLTTTTGAVSASQFFNLSGANLTGAPGNITITPSSGNIELSLSSNTGFSNSPLLVPYSGATLGATPVYVRLGNATPQGAFSGSVTCSGGGSSNSPVVNVTGGVFQNYYNTKANSGLTNPATWSTTTDGTGPSPADFVTPYQYFNIINQTNANYTGVWDVSNAGITTKVIVGNGTNPLTFTVLPGADSLTSATRVDVLNNATLDIQNNKRPFINNIATGSTIKFTQTGLTTADTIKVPALSYYNLVLKDGIKVLSGNTTTVRGDFTADHVVNFNGPTASPFATLNAFGDVNFTNGSTFEPLPSGDFGRITLAMNNNSGGPQNINAPGVDMLWFRIRRDTTTADNDIIVSPGTNLILGNASGGGLLLSQGAATSTTLSMTNSTLKLIGGAASTTTSLGQLNTTNCNISIEKSTGTTNAGTLRFTANSTLNNFTANFDAAFTRDSILVADNVKVNGTLALTKGKIVMASGKALTMDAAATFTGGSAASFVDGKVTRNTAAASAFVFPVGKAAAYRPATVTPADASASVYTAEYFTGPYSTLTFLAPLTGISNTEYWDISRTSGANATVSLSLNGTAVAGATASDEVGVAHFETGNWVSVSGTGITPGDATTGTAVSTFLSTFSPFTFGIKPGGTTYTFNGNGNWSNSANWAGGLIPPTNLVSPNKIIIDPTPGGQCIVDVIQQISTGAQFVISPNAKILLPANLIIQ